MAKQHKVGDVVNVKMTKRRAQRIATFRDLPIGTTFDWVDPENVELRGFYPYCRKVSPRMYQEVGGDGYRYEIGDVGYPVRVVS